jgi:hypothetical protein
MTGFGYGGVDTAGGAGLCAQGGLTGDEGHFWRASDDPAQHALFIDFTIWANAAPALVMFIATPMQKGLVMTLIEGLPLLLVAMTLWCLRPTRGFASHRSWIGRHAHS